MARLEGGLKTPSSDYFIPILRALVGKGGCARVGDLYDPVKSQMDLNDWDMDYLDDNSSPEPRWKNTMRVARDEMVKESLLEPTSVSGRGWWQISENGKQFIDDWAKRAGRSASWIG